MTAGTIQDLIGHAEAVLNPVLRGDRWFGDVAAAVESVSGTVFTGVCIDTGPSGFCAEQSAVAAMVTQGGGYQVKRVVAVWRDSTEGTDDKLFVLPPCGSCRQFLRDVDPANLDAEVVLSATDAVSLRDLLPLPGWSAQPARPVG